MGEDTIGVDGDLVKMKETRRRRQTECEQTSRVAVTDQNLPDQLLLRPDISRIHRNQLILGNPASLPH